jgi:hypothetical protein
VNQSGVSRGRYPNPGCDEAAFPREPLMIRSKPTSASPARPSPDILSPRFKCIHANDDVTYLYTPSSIQESMDGSTHDLPAQAITHHLASMCDRTHRTNRALTNLFQARTVRLWQTARTKPTGSCVSGCGTCTQLTPFDHENARTNPSLTVQMNRISPADPRSARTKPTGSCVHDWKAFGGRSDLARPGKCANEANFFCTNE